MMTEPEQTELAGMPEKPAARWLDVCVAGIDAFAFIGIVLQTLPRIPRLQDGHAELYKQASEAFNRMIMQEVGRVAYEDATERAIPHFNAIMDEARRISEESDTLTPPSDEQDQANG